MKKNKIAVFLVLIVCLFAFSGCKKNVGSEEDNPVKEEKAEEKETYTFGFSCIAKENPYFVTLKNSISETVTASGHTIIGLDDDTNLDSKRQIEQIQNMIDQGIDAIFLTPVDWQAITPALEALKKADVKIINVDAQVAEMDYVDAYIGSNNKNAGVICAEDLIQKFPDGGRIAILEAPGMNSVNERITGFEETLAGQGFEVVARENTEGDLNMSRDAMKRILNTDKDIVAVMCGNDPTAIGAYIAANEMGINSLSIYGIDGSPEVKKELEKKNTLIAGTAAQSPINMGKAAVEVALKMLNGEEYEKETYIDTYLITKENIDMYGSDGWQ